MQKFDISTVKYFTSQEITKLFSVISDKRDKALFTSIYYLGLRAVEATWLTVDDVNFNDSKILIRAAKRGKSGDQFLPKPAQKYLKAWLESREEMAYRLNIQSPALFLSRKRGALSVMQIERLFKNYCKKAKLKDESRHHPHSLRHSIAVHMADGGVPVEHVQILLRHKQIANTMIYYEITKKHEALRSAFNSAWIAKA